MSQIKDFPACGRVTKVNADSIVFAPLNTNYELHLQTSRRYDGPLGQLISAFVRAKARKVYTVPSGGGFIAPIFGSPRIVQGRALHIEDGTVVIRAGLPVIVEIPANDDAIDLAEGAIAVGSLVNAVTFSGASFEPALAAHKSPVGT